MAENDKKKDTSAKPGFDPKPVQLGGESIIERLIPHMKKIALGVLVIAGVLGIVFGVRAWKERGRKQDTAKLVKALEVANREVRPAGVEPDPAAKEPTFADPKERATAVLEALQKQGGNPGPVYRGSLLVTAGRLDEAITEYRKGAKAKGLDGVLAREGLGIAIETKAHAEKDAAARQKGLEEALAAFQSMQPDDKGPRHAYALYHQGRVLGLLGKTAEAKTTLEKAKTIDEGGELASLIDERLAGLGGS